MSKIIIEPTYGDPIDLTEKHNLQVTIACPKCGSTNTEPRLETALYPESPSMNYYMICNDCKKYTDLWEMG